MSSLDKDRIRLQRKVKAAGYIDTAASVANIAGSILPGGGLVGGVLGEVANVLDPQVRESNLKEELDKQQYELKEEFDKRFKANRASRKVHIREELDQLQDEISGGSISQNQ